MSHQPNKSRGAKTRGSSNKNPQPRNKTYAPRPQYKSQNTRGSQSMGNLQGPQPRMPYNDHYGSNPVYQQPIPLMRQAPPPYRHYPEMGYPMNSPPPFPGGRVCRTPPPSYDDVDKQGKKTKPKVEAIVKALSLFNGQWATADTIRKHIECGVRDIEAVVKSHGKIFSVMNNDNQLVIELVPKVGICMAYLSDAGCGSRDTCMNLHICKYFVLSSCQSGRECQFGHKWDTSHNSRVLSKFYLDLIDRQVLHQIMRKLCKGCVPPQICSFFNSKAGCKYGDRCGQLHICEDFVKNGGNCSCSSYSHDILTPHCRRILQRHDLSVNESPRDIIMALKAAIAKDEKMNTPSMSKAGEGNTKEKGKGGAKPEKKDTPNEKQESKGKGAKPKNVNENEGKMNTKAKSTNSKPQSVTAKRETCKSTDVLGDVVIPEICIYSIENKCVNESKGCRYLHAKSLFHWQAEKDQHWYNFRVFQSKILETAFRKVSNGTVTLPPLLDNKLDESSKELLSVLGTESWNVDFDTMSMINSSGKNSLNIRRISTRSAAAFTNPKSTVYHWFFMDEQGNWIQFGKIDSLGKQEFICNVTSEEIEKQYITDSSSFIEFANSKYKYKIDFSKMRQLNLGTGKERPVRRRPSGLSYQKTVPDQESALPSSWSPMQANQTHVLHALDVSTAEYKDVSKLLRMSLPSLNIVKIQRLQNPYLWRLFQYRQADLGRRYNENEMNIQSLFHCIDVQNIDTVCKENFDWRQGKTHTQEFGKGAYFSNRAAYTRQHCVPDNKGHFYMFVAQVIIGSVVKGSPELTRPPMNPSLDVLYDTTVDDVHNTTVFVKYDKEDYYPEYLVEFY